MIIENIARDAVLLISKHMLNGLQDSVNLSKKTQTEQVQRACSLWSVIKAEFQVTEVARNIVLDLEVTPDDEIVQAIFRHQLSKHLKKDADFLWSVEQTLYVRTFKAPTRTLITRKVLQGNRKSSQDLVSSHKTSSQLLPVLSSGME